VCVYNEDDLCGAVGHQKFLCGGGVGIDGRGEVVVVGVVNVVGAVGFTRVLLGATTKRTIYKHDLFAGWLVPVTSGMEGGNLPIPRFLRSLGRAGLGGASRSSPSSCATGHGL